jgi:hypothetical protein
VIGAIMPICTGFEQDTVAAAGEAGRAAAVATIASIAPTATTAISPNLFDI